MSAQRTIGVDERRARFARRHALAPAQRAGSVEEVAERLVCLHATDPPSIVLQCRARMDAVGVDDVRAALTEARTLVKQMAMRRTVWVLPRAALADAVAAVGERVAARERKALVKDVEASGLHAEGSRWLGGAVAAVLERLADGRAETMAQLRDALPVLQGTTTYGEGRSWGGELPVAPRVLTGMNAAGAILRGPDDAPTWTTSRPRYVAPEPWLGEPLTIGAPGDGLAAMTERWLRAFGPGTEADLKWWLGSTLRDVRAALAAVGAEAVDLGDGRTGWVAAGDAEPVEPVDPWAALLPPLDPTLMGWTERDHYLGPHKAVLFDANGNGGPTAWWAGRVVGGWRQDDAGRLELQLLEDVGAEATAALETERERLDAFLDGARVTIRFPSPLWKIVK